MPEQSFIGNLPSQAMLTPSREFYLRECSPIGTSGSRMPLCSEDAWECAWTVWTWLEQAWLDSLDMVRAGLHGQSRHG